MPATLMKEKSRAQAAGPRRFARAVVKDRPGILPATLTAGLKVYFRKEEDAYLVLPAEGNSFFPVRVSPDAAKAGLTALRGPDGHPEPVPEELERLLLFLVFLARFEGPS